MSLNFLIASHLIGCDNAEKLQEEFGGEYIYIPKRRTGRRMAMISYLIERDYTIKRIAGALAISERTVYRALKEQVPA